MTTQEMSESTKVTSGLEAAVKQLTTSAYRKIDNPLARNSEDSWNVLVYAQGEKGRGLLHVTLKKDSVLFEATTSEPYTDRLAIQSRQAKDILYVDTDYHSIDNIIIQFRTRIDASTIKNAIVAFANAYKTTYDIKH